MTFTILPVYSKLLYGQHGVIVLQGFISGISNMSWSGSVSWTKEVFLKEGCRAVNAPSKKL